MQRSTKIVATLGPASSDREVLTRMIAAGVDVVRMNFSHGSAEEHLARAELVREVARTMERTVGIMCDLQGPKIRIGKFEKGKITLNKGETFVLDAEVPLGNQERVGLDYKELPRDVSPGSVLLLDDGRMVLDVQKVQGSQITTTVRVGGVLSNNKGINRQGGGLTAPALTAKDMEDIKTSVTMKADFLAVYFPKSGADMYMAKELMRAAGGRSTLIAKMERAEAIAAMGEIMEASDGIMVARGDLAVEVGAAETYDSHRARAQQAHHHGDADDGVDDLEPGAHARGGFRRGKRGSRRHRCGDALRRDGQRKIPGGNRRGDGAHLPGGGEIRRGDARPRVPRSRVHPRGPVDRDGGAVYRVSPESQGDRSADPVRLDRSVDFAPELRRADLRVDAGDLHALPVEPVPRCLSAY